jgi:hypothetical protein
MSEFLEKVSLPSLKASVSLSRCWILWFSLLLCGIQPLHAGMTSYGVDSVAEFRLQALSFFLFLLLVLSWGLKRLWNGLRSAFPSWPTLTFRWAFGLLLLFGLLIHVVLTMIAGARELMTPGAWEKDGSRYRLRVMSGSESVPRDMRMAGIEDMKERIWNYALEHKGKVPDGPFGGEIPWKEWRAPTGGVYCYLARKSIGGGRELLLYEPTEAGSKRFVLLSDGSIEEWSESKIYQTLEN